MPKDKLREISKKGQLASAAKRSQNVTFRKALQFALSMPAFQGNDTVDRLLKKFPNLNNYEAIALAMCEKAILDGDTKAFVAIRNTTGELPEQLINVKNDKPMSININMLNDDGVSDIDMDKEPDADDDSDDDTEEEA